MTAQCAFTTVQSMDGAVRRPSLFFLRNPDAPAGAHR